METYQTSLAVLLVAVACLGAVSGGASCQDGRAGNPSALSPGPVVSATRQRVERAAVAADRRALEAGWRRVERRRQRLAEHVSATAEVFEALRRDVPYSRVPADYDVSATRAAIQRADAALLGLVVDAPWLALRALPAVEAAVAFLDRVEDGLDRIEAPGDELDEVADVIDVSQAWVDAYNAWVDSAAPLIGALNSELIDQLAVPLDAGPLGADVESWLARVPALWRGEAGRSDRHQRFHAELGRALARSERPPTASDACLRAVERLAAALNAGPSGAAVGAGRPGDATTWASATVGWCRLVAEVAAGCGEW